MLTIEIDDAETQLSRLVDRAAKGESFIIVKSGKPLVRMSRLDAPSSGQIKRIGFMAGQFSVPDDVDSMGAHEIETMFVGALKPVHKSATF